MSIVNTPRNSTLSGLNIAVVGAGRVGSEVIRNLGLMGIGRIDVFERDREAAAPLRSRYQVYDGDFWDSLTLARLQSYDFAVCTIDASDARRRMNGKCLLAGVNFLQLGAAGTLARVSAYPFGLGHDSACAECGTSASAAVSMPLASLRMSAEANPLDASVAAATHVATASLVGAVAAAMIGRMASGSFGTVSRAATLDATLGQGASEEVRPDAQCPRCSQLQRPVPIVHTRNRWEISGIVAQSCAGILEQQLKLGDAPDGATPASGCLRELSARFGGGPAPAKFALADVGGRTICLAFEEADAECARKGSRAAAGSHPFN